MRKIYQVDDDGIIHLFVPDLVLEVYPAVIVEYSSCIRAGGYARERKTFKNLKAAMKGIAQIVGDPFNTGVVRIHRVYDEAGQDYEISWQPVLKKVSNGVAKAAVGG